jgi:mRNA interferase MazF
VRRGEIWTAAAGAGYAGKQRPVLIVQDDRFDATSSVTICAFTTDPTEATLFRLPVERGAINGLTTSCRLMVDKITTIPKGKLGQRIGRLDERDMHRFDRAALIFLGLVGRSQRTEDPEQTQG